MFFTALEGILIAEGFLENLLGKFMVISFEDLGICSLFSSLFTRTLGIFAVPITNKWRLDFC